MKATSRDRKSLESISDIDLFLVYNETRFVKSAYSLLNGRYFILKVFVINYCNKNILHLSAFRKSHISTL